MTRTRSTGFRTWLFCCLLLCAAASLGFTTRAAQASDVQFVGNVDYSFFGNNAVILTADQVENFDSFGYSGTLQLELWAFPSPYDGSFQFGYKLAQYSLGSLTAGYSFYNLNSGHIAFFPPPDGVWYFVLVLTEFTGGPTNGGYDFRDWFSFYPPVVFGSSPGATSVAVEYYYAAWNFFFVTAFPDEIAALDGGAFGGAWQRTGETFLVWSQPTGGAFPTCRFFSTIFAPRSSHFYTPYPSECASLKAGTGWQYEAIAFYLQLPGANGYCPVGTTILYRLYNNGMGGAPNHRFTTNGATFNQMLAAGWIFEGDGRTGAFACVPL